MLDPLPSLVNTVYMEDTNMDNAERILKAHIAEYGPGLSSFWFQFMCNVLFHVQYVSAFERIQRA